MKSLNYVLAFVTLLAFTCKGNSQPNLGKKHISENPNQDNPPPFVVNMEKKGLAQPFHGVTTNGEREKGLFPIQASGVSTAPIMEAARNFLAGLTEEQQNKTLFPIDDEEWRKWCNMHFYPRQGVALKEMTEAQKELAFSLLSHSLSAKGLELSRRIMMLEGHMARLLDNFAEYGEERYYFTLMGEPSMDDPWGWQLDGHHLIINFFVLGDQVVMTPTFMGSEPTRADEGEFAGTVVFEEEEKAGLDLIQGLTPEQQSKAIVVKKKTKNFNRTEAFRDNQKVPYQGILATEFTASQKELFLSLIYQYVGNIRSGHDEVRMEEVKKHMDHTYFSWVGGTQMGDVFYYRIHSPVILIEFDHQGPVALRNTPRGVPTRNHVHTVVRTPNGNDYGKDLLRQHLEEHH